MKYLVIILFFMPFGKGFSQRAFYYNHLTPYSNAPNALTECDQGFLIAGANSLSGAHANGFLMLLDKTGNVIWEKIIPATEPDKYTSYTAANFHQGFFYVGGFSWIDNQRRNLLLKIDLDGNIIWSEIFGEDPVFGGDNFIQDLQINQNGILVATSGYNAVNTSTDAALIQLDMEANILWSKFYSADNLSILYSDRMEKIFPTSDGYLLQMNSLYTSTSHYDNYIIKIDRQGDEIWRKNLTLYQSPSEHADTMLYFRSVTNFKDNHVIAYFVVEHAATQNQILIEFDENGNEIDYRKYEEKISFSSSNLHINKNSEIFITSMQWFESPLHTQLYAAKFSVEKELLWEHHYGVENIAEFYLCGLLTSDGGVLLGGRDQHFQFGTPYFNSIIIKTDCNGNTDWDYQSCLSPTFDDITIFPNPSSISFTIQLPNIQTEDIIQLKVFDLTGKLMFSGRYIGEEVISINSSAWALGAYICRISVNNEVVKTKKLLKAEGL